MRISRSSKAVSALAVVGVLTSGTGVLAAANEAAFPSELSMSAAAATPEFSRVLWVSPSGQDTAAGTESAPFRTVAKALSQVKPGEAIFLKSGTYTERPRLEEKGGSSSLYLTLKAAPGAKPVFKGGTGSKTPLLDVRGAYWRVEGLTFDAAGDKAFAAYWRGGERITAFFVAARSRMAPRARASTSPTRPGTCSSRATPSPISSAREMTAMACACRPTPRT